MRKETAHAHEFQSNCQLTNKYVCTYKSYGDLPTHVHTIYTESDLGMYILSSIFSCGYHVHLRT